MVPWKRNLLVLCAAQFLTLLGFSSYMSFIPYYLQEMGVQSDAAAMSWTAAIQTGGAIAMRVAAPIWGGLADRYGRKIMLVRATGIAAVLAFLMGLVQAPWQLLVIRILQGAFCGTVAAAMTLIATSTPESSLGQSMGMMQMTQHVSHAVGPFLGGMAADALGFRSVFPGASVLMVIALSIVILFVREDREALPTRAVRHHERVGEGAARRLADANALVLIGALAGTSLAFATLSPVMALYIKSLAPDSEHLATLAGGVTSVSAITSSIAALGIGRLGDRIGQKRALLISTIGVALVAIPQGLVRTTAQLAVLRGVHGIFVGGIMPTANALLAQATPRERRGAVLGLASGAQSGGRALGPTLGAAAAGSWGMRSAFLLNGSIFLVLSGLVALLVKPRPAAAETAPAGAPLAEAGPAAPAKLPRRA